MLTRSPALCCVVSRLSNVHKTQNRLTFRPYNNIIICAHTIAAFVAIHFSTYVRNLTSLFLSLRPKLILFFFLSSFYFMYYPFFSLSLSLVSLALPSFTDFTNPALATMGTWYVLTAIGSSDGGDSVVTLFSCFFPFNL